MNDRDPIKYLGRHLVCISGWCYPTSPEELQKGQKQFFAYAGVVLSVRGNWFLLTAGHVIENLEELEKSTVEGHVKVQYQLIDYFGIGAKSHEPIQFVFSKTIRKYFYDQEKGLDFGLIRLSEYYQGLLENNGIAPIAEENYGDRDQEGYDLYFMLGLPKKYLEADLRYGNSGEVRLRGKITPGLVPVERLDSLPDSFPQKEYPRFIGKISSEYSLEDVDGMSGGPIFGLNSKSGWYWIAAIQSSFLEDRGIIFGCPVPLIGAIVEETIKLANSAPDESY